jgi:3'-5' exoribonuclease
MYLEENIKKLNANYEGIPISFKLVGDIIKIQEEEPFYLSKNNKLKQSLQKKYRIAFDKVSLWHIRGDSVKRLGSKKLKFQPNKSIDALSQILGKFIEKIEEEKLRTSLEKYLKANNYFYRCPAAIYHHHAYEGGLLEHSYQTVKLALIISKQIKIMDESANISMDLVIAGSILHDIGKINCYEIKDGLIVGSNILSEQNHIINGVAIISEHIESEKKNDLIHIIASHHQITDWGSPVPPQTQEAWIISLIENLSSKIMG